MTASRDAIVETINAYVDLVAGGTTEEILDLFAEGATVEDPVGTPVRRTREEIAEFYGALSGLKQEATLQGVRINAGQAAFWFELVTHTDEAVYTIAPVDVMTFDDDAKITSMRAYWCDADFAISPR